MSDNSDNIFSHFSAHFQLLLYPNMKYWISSFRRKQRKTRIFWLICFRSVIFHFFSWLRSLFWRNGKIKLKLFRTRKYILKSMTQAIFRCVRFVLIFYCFSIFISPLWSLQKGFTSKMDNKNMKGDPQKEINFVLVMIMSLRLWTRCFSKAD